MRSRIDGPATMAAIEPHLASDGPLLVASLTAADADLLAQLLEAVPQGLYLLPTLSQLQDRASLELLKQAAFMQMNEHEGETRTGSSDPTKMLSMLRE